MDSLGHAWQSIVIRDATCETDGKLLELCSRCGQMKQTATPKGEHQYKTYPVAATCTNPGYTVRECSVCGDRHIEDITSVLPHNYESHVIAATCEGGGKTIHRCAGCGSSFVTDYTAPLGHSWDEGTLITNATCTGEGVMEYRCVRCGYHRIEGNEAAGHIPGNPATCMEPQLCTRCGAVLKNALGHDYKSEVTAPTCTEMGYTTNTCTRCGDSNKSDYTEPAGHKPGDWIIDKEPTTDSEGSKHKECENCGETLETAEIDKIYNSGTTDSRGEAIVGGYLVTVTDTDTKDPVANAAVTLHKDNSISIRLPNSRLLDYADQTTVTVQLVKDKSAVPGMSIAVTDKNDNYSSGKTDAAGQITVPTGSGKTNEDGKVTGGYEDADGNRWTLTVKVIRTDTKRPIPGSDVSIGKTGNISIILPDGTDMDAKHQVTIVVTDNKKVPQENKNITVKNDLNQTASGKTDKNGELTVPETEETERHGVYILGYPDGTFGPARSMTRSEAAAIFARCWQIRTATPSPPRPTPSLPIFPPTPGTPATSSTSTTTVSPTARAATLSPLMTPSPALSLPRWPFASSMCTATATRTSWSSIRTLAMSATVIGPPSTSRPLPRAAGSTATRMVPSAQTATSPELRSSPSSTACWPARRMRATLRTIFASSIRSEI